MEDKAVCDGYGEGVCTDYAWAADKVRFNLSSHCRARAEHKSVIAGDRILPVEAASSEWYVSGCNVRSDPWSWAEAVTSVSGCCFEKGW